MDRCRRLCPYWSDSTLLTRLVNPSLRIEVNHDGNLTARDLDVIVRSIAEDLGIKPRVEVAASH